MLKQFMERLAERLASLVASSLSSTVQRLHALGQAEQQSEMEEAARRYEAEGKPEIARILRQRAAGLTSDNPASEALGIIGNVEEVKPQRLSSSEQESDTDLNHLPDLASSPSSTTRKKKSSRKSSTKKTAKGS